MNLKVFLKSNYNKIIKWEYFPFLLFFIFSLIVNFKMTAITNDDLFFQRASSPGLFGLFEFLEYRYFGWSSRVIIEFFLVLMTKSLFIFRVLNSIIYTLLPLSIYKLLPYKKKGKDVAVLLFILIIFLPITLFNGAGWIATNLNYLWPVTFGLIALLPIKKIMNKEKINKWEYFIYVPCLIFASNQEQVVIGLIIFYFLAIVYELIKKNYYIYLFVGFIISIFSFVFIMTCPGNTVRKEQEIQNWFPEFVDLTLLKRLEMAYSSTFFPFIMKFDLIFLALMTVILIVVLLKNRSKVIKFISFITLFLLTIFGIMPVIYSDWSYLINNYNVFNKIETIRLSLTGYGTFNGRGIIDIFPDLIIMIVIVSLIILIYFIFDDKKIFNLLLLVLGYGLLTRIILAMSPTIWASGNRTFFIIYISIIYATISLYQKLRMENSIKRKNSH